MGKLLAWLMVEIKNDIELHFNVVVVTFRLAKKVFFASLFEGFSDDSYFVCVVMIT